MSAPGGQLAPEDAGQETRAGSHAPSESPVSKPTRPSPRPTRAGSHAEPARPVSHAQPTHPSSRAQTYTPAERRALERITRRRSRSSRTRVAQVSGRHGGLVTIVVPAKDEEAAVGKTLRSLPIATLQATGFEVDVVVLDGQSGDATVDIARQLGATIVVDREPGKGAALRNARPLLKGDYIVMLDADGTYAPDAIPHVLGPLVWGEADLVAGTRRAQAGAMSGTHRVGNALLSFGARVLYAKPCPDVCTGLWGFRADALRRLPLRSRGFELEAEIFALSSRLGLRMAHVPVDYLPRQGATKLSGARDGLRIGWWLLRSRFAPLPPADPGPSDGGHEAALPHTHARST